MYWYYWEKFHVYHYWELKGEKILEEGYEKRKDWEVQLVIEDGDTFVNLTAISSKRRRK